MLILYDIIEKLVADSVFDLDENNCDLCGTESLVRSDNCSNDSVLIVNKRIY